MLVVRFVSVAALVAAVAVIGCGDDGGGNAGNGTGGSVGAGGSGGSAGTGGTGATDSCPDRVGERPTLTAQPTFTPDVSPGGLLTLEVPVSEEARFVVARVIDGFVVNGALTFVGEASSTTAGSETVSLTIPIDSDAFIGRDHFIDILLCVDPNCLTAEEQTSITYMRGDLLASDGARYFIRVRDDGVVQTQLNKFSCYDLLVYRPVAPNEQL